MPPHPRPVPPAPTSSTPLRSRTPGAAAVRRATAASTSTPATAVSVAFAARSELLAPTVDPFRGPIAVRGLEYRCIGLLVRRRRATSISVERRTGERGAWTSSTCRAWRVCCEFGARRGVKAAGRAEILAYVRFGDLTGVCDGKLDGLRSELSRRPLRKMGDSLHYASLRLPTPFPTGFTSVSKVFEVGRYQSWRDPRDRLDHPASQNGTRAVMTFPQ